MDEKDQPRFNIVNAFAETFKGLPECIETNLHRASRCGDCIWVSTALFFVTLRAWVNAAIVSLRVWVSAALFLFFLCELG